jgi:hypothetical protein
MVTVASIETKIDNLRTKINSTTGKSDADLTSSVNSLIGMHGKPIGVATEAEMATILEAATADTVGKVYKYTGESTDTYENGAIYIVETEGE